jgi:transcriptional regulator with XRE-family HTH domain
MYVNTVFFNTMVLSYLLRVNDGGGARDLRTVLSQNIRSARGELHITQAKLAEYADISISYMSDIEYCRTWVSDKTLLSIARALNREAYQLLIPARLDASAGASAFAGRETRILQRITGLIAAKKNEMKKAADSAMSDLVQEIIKVYTE